MKTWPNNVKFGQIMNKIKTVDVNQFDKLLSFLSIYKCDVYLKEEITIYQIKYPMNCSHFFLSLISGHGPHKVIKE